MLFENEMCPLCKERMQVSNEMIQCLKHYFYKSTSNVEGLSLQILLKFPKPSGKIQMTLTSFLYNINPVLTHEGVHLLVKTSLLTTCMENLLLWVQETGSTPRFISVCILALSIKSVPHTASKLRILRQNASRCFEHI